MKKLLLFALLLIAPSCFAQGSTFDRSNPLGGDIRAQSTACGIIQSCVWQKLPVGSTTLTITVSNGPVGSFSATLQFEQSNDGINFVAASPASTTAAGTFTFTVTGFTDFRVRASTYASGDAAVNMQAAGGNGGGGGGGGSSSFPVTTNVFVNSGGSITPTGTGLINGLGVASLPALINQPVTRGLLAAYYIKPGETAATLIDYSGNGNNATGTVGVAPTITAVTGGVACSGNGGINLPAALNSALSIQMYASFQWAAVPLNNNPSTQMLVGGNGANPIQLDLFSSTVGDSWGPSLQGGYRIRSFSTGNVFKSGSRDVFQGVHSLAFLMDTTDRFFIDSTEVTYYQSLVSAGLQTNGNYQLCGVTPNYATATIYPILFYSVVLTNAEVAQNDQFFGNIMAARFVSRLNGATDNQNQLICDGDSLTQGGTNYCAAYSLPNPTSAVLSYAKPLTPYNIADQGLNSASTPALVTNIPTDTLSLVRPLAPSNIVTFWAGTNNSVPTQPLGDIRGYCAKVKAAGAKCLPFTMISRTGEDGQKNIINTWLRNHWNEFADGLVDLAANPNLGADGASANGTYYTDGIHLTTTGNAIVTSISQQAILRATGNAAPAFQGSPNVVPPQFQAIQSATASCLTSVSTCAVTFTNNTAAGNFVFLLVEGAGGQTINVPTDTRTSTWTSVATAANIGGKLLQAYFAPNVTAGAETITVTFGGAGVNSTLTAVEYSGVLTAAPLDVASTIATGTSATQASNSATTTATNELLITYSGALQNSALLNNNFTSIPGQSPLAPTSVLRVQSSINGSGQSTASGVFDTMSAATGAYTSQTSIVGPTPNWGIGIAAFKAGTRIATYQMTGADVLVYCNPAVASSTISLPDAIGFTGQTFTIKNIQTAGVNTCTVAAINSETIDGAASVTVANKATLVVQSQLVSAIAGGANWVQLQNN